MWGQFIDLLDLSRILLKFEIQICRQTLSGTKIDEKLVLKILKFTKYILNISYSKISLKSKNIYYLR